MPYIHTLKKISKLNKMTNAYNKISKTEHLNENKK